MNYLELIEPSKVIKSTVAATCFVIVGQIKNRVQFFEILCTYYEISSHVTIITGTIYLLRKKC